MKMTTDHKDLVTVPELAQRIGCGKSTAYGLVKSGRVRAVRLTAKGSIRVPVEAIAEFIKSLDAVDG
jgi:excisionase family DNA binding protein